jgi:predicted GIY-YIG superfamily endonuclease
LHNKDKIAEGFRSKYDLNKLVYFEDYSEISLAIKREKRLKEWKRQWKIELIEKIILNEKIYTIKFIIKREWIPRSSRGMTKRQAAA